MPATDDPKALRTQRKGAVTKEINRIRQRVAEEEPGEVEERLGRLKELFKQFEKAHDACHSVIVAESADVAASENYFLEVQNSYIECLTCARKWLKSLQPPVGTSGAGMSSPQVGASGVLCASDVVSLLNLPKVELEVFDGDPVKYHSFMTVFNESVHKANLDDQVKLTRLLQYTVGPARDAIRSCVLAGSSGYYEARDILATRFGNKHLVAERVLRKVRQGKPVRNAQELRGLADDLAECFRTFVQINEFHEINNQYCIVQILERVQPYLRNRWKRKALESKREKDAYPGFREFLEFVREQADEATDPIYGTVGEAGLEFKPVRGQQKPASFHTSVGPEVPVVAHPGISCFMCKENHKIWSCKAFKDLRPSERLEIVRKEGLCENCLLKNHTTSQCRKPSVCSVPGCGQKHTRYVHIGGSSRPPNVTSPRTSSAVVSCSTSAGTMLHIPVVSVNVRGYETRAMLDSASTASFCTKSLVNAVGLKTGVANYQLSTLTQPCKNVTSEVVDLTLLSSDGRESLHVRNAYVVDNIPIYNPTVSFRDYDHLRGLPLDPNEGQVDLLLGQDNSEALLPLEVRRGRKGEPFAIRTMFGWAVNGSLGNSSQVGRRVVSNFVSTTALESKLNRLWDIENKGFEPADKLQNSVTDNQVLQLWDREVRLVDNHYELPIPWKDGVTVPNNVNVALFRLKSLKSSLDRRGLYDRYNEEVEKLIEKGYAEPVPSALSDTSGGKTWYLPHHAVITPKKPGKVRIVYDCASKYLGESLNDKCLQGPDLNNKLLHVLLRFRQFEFAIMGDIEAMYFQVLIPCRDRDALRFLWFEPPSGQKDGGHVLESVAGDNHRIVSYRMTRHVFGGIWCASSSTYALRRVLRDNGGVDPVVLDTVMRGFYVDDLLRSVATEEEAVQVVFGTRELLGKGGFNLTKFVTNAAAVGQLIPEEHRASETKSFEHQVSSKALGVHWNVGTDDFFFEVHIPACGVITRRVMLGIISSLFDPLGLVSPALVKGKILFQDATRMQFGWDDHITGDLENAWKRWLESLRDLSETRVPRCLVSRVYLNGYMELHHFSDASERAYGSCSYLRVVNSTGGIHVALLISRGRVSPIKGVTIPRLELQAAVMSAQMDCVLREEMDLHLVKSYFWVDSELVLQYIHNESLRLQVYVANRVGTILSLTQRHQWHHVPGSENPADFVSRGLTPTQLEASSWVNGPNFLHQFKSEWNLPEKCPPLLSSDTEVRQHSCALVACAPDLDPLERLFQYYSDWGRLKRGVAWWLKLKDRLRNPGISRQEDHCLDVSDLVRAEKAILRHVQLQCYPQEVKNLSSGQSVRSSSKIVSLSPIMDEDGILRVGGRLERALTSHEARHGFLVPHGHVIASLIARHYHGIAHLGTEWVVGCIRKKYWVTSCRTVVRSIRRSCVTCRKLFAEPQTQRMADLPITRLEAGNPPFTYIGTDCFGPFLVRRARSEIKRYGCVFTCLTTRAIHVEVLNTLETDSFLNAFRRFVSRRGQPEIVYSDNGTNYVGARRELSENLKFVDPEVVRAYGVQREIKWVFNPPGASHMGGIYERVIRTIRKVLTGVMRSVSCLTDEGLSTLFCEVEAIVNSRPITKISTDVKDPAPLTPSHLLLLRENVVIPPGKFDDTDLYRKRWRCVQSLADQFWSRWVKEYLPELQRRYKWHELGRNLQKGDLVLISEATPRGLWPLGLVEEIHESSDGLVRSVKVRTRSTQLVRPITKIVLLEGYEKRFASE